MRRSEGPLKYLVSVHSVLDYVIEVLEEDTEVCRGFCDPWALKSLQLSRDTIEQLSWVLEKFLRDSHGS